MVDKDCPEGSILATPIELEIWIKTLAQP